MSIQAKLSPRFLKSPLKAEGNYPYSKGSIYSIYLSPSKKGGEETTWKRHIGKISITGNIWLNHKTFSFNWTIKIGSIIKIFLFLVRVNIESTIMGQVPTLKVLLGCSPVNIRFDLKQIVINDIMGFVASLCTVEWKKAETFNLCQTRICCPVWWPKSFKIGLKRGNSGCYE